MSYKLYLLFLVGFIALAGAIPVENQEEDSKAPEPAADAEEEAKEDESAPGEEDEEDSEDEKQESDTNEDDKEESESDEKEEEPENAVEEKEEEQAEDSNDVSKRGRYRCRYVWRRKRKCYFRKKCRGNKYRYCCYRKRHCKYVRYRVKTACFVCRHYGCYIRCYYRPKRYCFYRRKCYRTRNGLRCRRFYRCIVRRRRVCVRRCRRRCYWKYYG